MLLVEGAGVDPTTGVRLPIFQVDYSLTKGRVQNSTMLSQSFVYVLIPGNRQDASKCVALSLCCGANMSLLAGLADATGNIANALKY